MTCLLPPLRYSTTGQPPPWPLMWATQGKGCPTAETRSWHTGHRSQGGHPCLGLEEEEEEVHLSFCALEFSA